MGYGAKPQEACSTQGAEDIEWGQLPPPSPVGNPDMLHTYPSVTPARGSLLNRLPGARPEDLPFLVGSPEGTFAKIFLVEGCLFPVTTGVQVLATGLVA